MGKHVCELRSFLWMWTGIYTLLQHKQIEMSKRMSDVNMAQQSKRSGIWLNCMDGERKNIEIETLHDFLITRCPTDYE